MKEPTLEDKIGLELLGSDIWQKIGRGKIPEICFKLGGHSGCYYPNQHKVAIRWNVWNKLLKAEKRLLMIHELWHARTEEKETRRFGIHGLDLISIEVYKKIYGEDKEWQELQEKIQTLIFV